MGWERGKGGTACEGKCERLFLTFKNARKSSIEGSVESRVG